MCYIPCDDGKSYDTFYAGSLNEISYSYSFVYGKNNKLIQTIEYNYDAEGISQKTVRFLNIDGKPTKVQQFDPDDELVNEIVMKYDKLVVGVELLFFNQFTISGKSLYCFL